MKNQLCTKTNAVCPLPFFYIIGPGIVTELLRVAYYTGTSVIIMTIIPGEVRLWPCWFNNILVEGSWMSLSYTRQKAGLALLSQQFKPTMWESSHSIFLDWLETGGHLCPGPQSWVKQLRKMQDSQYEFILRLVVYLQIPSWLSPLSQWVGKEGANCALCVQCEMSLMDNTHVSVFSVFLIKR